MADSGLVSELEKGPDIRPVGLCLVRQSRLCQSPNEKTGVVSEFLFIVTMYSYDGVKSNQHPMQAITTGCVVFSSIIHLLSITGSEYFNFNTQDGQ